MPFAYRSTVLKDDSKSLKHNTTATIKSKLFLQINF